MSALPNARKRRSPAEVVSQWWQSWTSNAPASDLACCAEGEVEQIAKDIGMPASEIRRLANLGPESAELLSRRMAALHLDRKQVAQTHPQTFRDLQRVCTLCEGHRQCARDLARNSGDPGWEEYCPNAATLRALNANPQASRRE